MKITRFSSLALVAALVFGVAMLVSAQTNTGYSGQGTTGTSAGQNTTQPNSGQTDQANPDRMTPTSVQSSGQTGTYGQTSTGVSKGRRHRGKGSKSSMNDQSSGTSADTSASTDASVGTSTQASGTGMRHHRRRSHHRGRSHKSGDQNSSQAAPKTENPQE